MPSSTTSTALCLAHLKMTGWWKSKILKYNDAFLHNSTNAAIYFNHKRNAWEFLANEEPNNKFTANTILTLNEIMSSTP